MVMLAVRPIGGYTTLGRETFLARVTWENGWPVVNSGEGRLTDKVEVNLPEWKPSSQADIYTKIREYDFCSMKRLSHEFVMLRNPDKDMYVLKSDKGLGLMYGSATLRDEASPSYVAVRQQHHHFTAIAVLSTDSISSNKNAGMALVQSNEYNLRIEMGRIDEEAFNVNIIKCCQGVDNVVATKLIKATDSTKQVEIVLKVEGLSASVWLITSDNTTPLVEGIDIHWLSTEVAGGFVGCTVGMYATSARKDISNVEGDRAYFKRFIYCNEEAFS
jgi:alpha-N-arabinofuranosidase